MKTQVLILLALLSVSFANAQLIKNDFLSGTTQGEWTLEKYPTSGYVYNEYVWKETNASSANVSLSIVAPLEYSGYVESGKGNAINLPRLSSSTSRTFGYAVSNNNQYMSGTYYVAFMMQGHNGTIAGDYVGILTLDGRYYLTYQRIAVCIKANTARDAFYLGLAEKEATSTVNYMTDVCDFDQTYLVVLKYNMDTGKADLFLNPVLSETEPTTPDVSINNTDLVTSNAGIQSITLKQRTNHTCTMGGFRFATTWKGAIGYEQSTSINPLQSEKGEILSESYYSLSGVQLKDPLATGLYVKKTIYANGEVETSKVYYTSEQ